MKTISFNLPAPPSSNRIWRVSNNRVHKSTEYTTWLKDMAWIVIQQIGPRKQSEALQGPLSVTLVVHPSDGRNGRRDLDNSIKPVLDFMEHIRLIDNDRDVTRIIALKGDRKQRHHIEVTVNGT